MSDGNGSPVTRAELAAHIKGIDEHFDVVEQDVKDIKGLIEGIYQTFRLERRERAAKWRAWGPPIIAAVVAAGVTVPVALLVH